MKPMHKKLLQEQLDTTIKRLECLNTMQRPVKGWLRAIREALGMSGRQFAKRLGVSAPRITMLEKKERQGSVTLNTMHQAAEALNCKFVYALVPRENSLKETVRKRAESLAKKRLTRVSHTMLLEAQNLSDTEQQKAIENEINTLINELPRDLWENHDNF